jgi:hypothetical protein
VSHAPAAARPTSGFDGTSITYQATADDWGQAIVRLRRRASSVPFWWLLPAGFVILGLVNLSLGEWVGAVALVIGGLMALVLNSGRVNGFIIRRQIRPLIEHPVTLTLADDGLQAKAGPSAWSLAWSGVHDLIVDPHVVMVTRAKTISWSIIPRTAFRSDGEVATFRQTIIERRDRARRTTGVGNGST